jgi:hypothetical protein
MIALVHGVGLHAGDVKPVLDSVIAKNPSWVPATNLEHTSSSALAAEFVTVSAGPVLHVERQPPGRRHFADLLRHQHRFRKPMPLPPSSSGSPQEKSRARPSWRRDRRELLRSSSPASAQSLCRESPGRVLYQSLLFAKFEIHFAFPSIACHSSFDYEEKILILDTVTDFHLDLLHRAATGRVHGVLHLQRFDDDEFIVLLDFGTRFDQHSQDFSRQRSQNICHSYSLLD